MSSFTLDFKDIGNAVKSLSILEEKGELRDLGLTSTFLEKEEKPNDLFRKLVQTNALAVKFQYGLEDVEIDKKDIKFLKAINYEVDSFESVSLTQAFKTLCCWSYNTEEFEHPGCFELIQRMNIFIDELDPLIDINEYSKCKWG